MEDNDANNNWSNEDPGTGKEPDFKQQNDDNVDIVDDDGDGGLFVDDV